MLDQEVVCGVYSYVVVYALNSLYIVAYKWVAVPVYNEFLLTAD